MGKSGAIGSSGSVPQRFPIGVQRILEVIFTYRIIKAAETVDGDGIDEEIEDESEVENETGDEDNENIDQDEIEIGQEPYFQLINENINMGHQEGDNVDGISTRDEEYTIVSDDEDDTSASSLRANMPTPGTNSPIDTLDDSEHRTPVGPTREANTVDDGSLTITDLLQDEAQRQDVDQTPPSSPDIYSTVRSFVDSEEPQLEYVAKQLENATKRFENRQKRFEDAKSILTGLAELEREDAVKTNNIKEIDDNLSNRKAEWDNSQPTPTSIGDTSLEEYMSRAKSFFLGVEEGKTKRQAEESGLAENKNKRAKLKAEFKELQATAANREPSLPIRSLESF
ncbi:uncharacterized protein T069G_11204 [Trichoderma breve]|uniref:Uncharacterized protein n=1 Tax=Trichoderma breve TaxID=2034170 RepID=A0A9W9E2F5_9HYPO|nr:uncharacterized protein T069G_11204 [Trichoderma breve]KAJ4854225.1 hypothetical protein T069G_11204 [Trichoderma breve]